MKTRKPRIQGWLMVWLNYSPGLSCWLIVAELMSKQLEREITVNPMEGA